MSCYYSSEGFWAICNDVFFATFATLVRFRPVVPSAPRLAFLPRERSGLPAETPRSQAADPGELLAADQRSMRIVRRVRALVLDAGACFATFGNGWRAS